MRVAFDVTSLHDARTGIGVVTTELLRRLAGRPSIDAVAYSVSWRGRDRVAELVREAVGPDTGGADVEVARGPMAAQPLRRLWRRVDLPPLEWWTGPIDVAFGLNFVVPPTRRAARVALVHDLTVWRFPELGNDDTRQYPGLIGRAVRTGAHVVTPSQAVADEVVDRIGADPTRVHPVHWAPSPAPAAGGDPEAGRRRAGGARYVLTVGTIEPRKDHALLVRAFDAVADIDADLRLVVAGQDGWGVERFDAAVAAARHPDRIVRTGFVDDAARADLLAGATAFAYPSVYEGFGLPPLEAMAAGIPVIATATGALPEVLGDAAALVPPGDVDGLAAAIARLTGDDRATDRAAIVERGRAHAATFSWDTAADRVEAALTAAVGDRTIPRQ